MSNRFVASIANILIFFQSRDTCISFLKDGSIKEYIKSATDKLDYNIDFFLVKEISSQNYNLQFKGEPENNEFLNYKWEVYKNDRNILLKVYYFDHISIKEIGAYLDKNSSHIRIKVVPKTSENFTIEIDPLIHPLGSLLLLHIMNWRGALLMHGSAVNMGGNTYLFTGASGIGKSTMARLWAECGAEIINDDRLILKPENGNVRVYNNPMPYYVQYPKDGNLKSIFLLKQSPENYIKPIAGVAAYSNVLGNCIQQFYEKDMIQSHLEIVEQIISQVKVYEVGFLPNHDIVKMIIEMNNRG